MSYEEARVYLDTVAKYGSVLGLDTMRELLVRLGNPQDDLEFIHLAGTNGKGSVLAFLSTILKEAGYQVGRYISPTLFSYRERIQVNEEYIEKEALARLTTLIREAADQMEREGLSRPTAFEIETALSFLYFKEKQCDLVVLETGLGGRDDATNVVNTKIMEVISSISMDHLGVLGDSLREIAECKAGIIREKTLVVSQVQQPEAMEVIERTVREKEGSLRLVRPEAISQVEYGYETQRFSYGSFQNIVIHLAGTYQIENAALAVEVVEGLRSLGYGISDTALYRGMEKTVWRGRFTVLSKEPILVMDGAHNEDAARKLCESIELYFKGKKISYIMGVFQDKEYEKIIRLTAPYAKRVTCVETPHSPRALPKEELCKAWIPYVKQAETAESIGDAVKRNMELADKEDVIIAFGSLSFLGEVEKAVKAIGR